MEEERTKVKALMEQLENLSKDNYELFELALVLFLRGDVTQFDYYTDNNDIDEIKKELSNYNSIIIGELAEFVDKRLYDV